MLIRYRLSTLLQLIAAIAIPLGLLRIWSASRTLAILILIATGLALVTRKRKWVIVSVVYGAILPIAWIYMIVELSDETGPYVRWYNQRMNQIAMSHHLVGRPESDVEVVLGVASTIYRSWSITRMNTGLPTPDAEFITTFNYAPFPELPMKKFQVHCEGGKVRTLEMFDD
jgi:hypothetical protein